MPLRTFVKKEISHIFYAKKKVWYYSIFTEEYFRKRGITAVFALLECSMAFEGWVEAEEIGAG